MQNDKSNETKMTRAELLAEIEKQKAIIAAKEQGASDEEIEKIQNESSPATEENSGEGSTSSPEDSVEEKKKLTAWQMVGKIAYIAFTALLALILVINVWMIISRNVLKNPNPTFCGIGYFVVETPSMDGDRPDRIKPWTLVFTVKKKEYKVDDIITFEGARVSSVTHRIIAVNEDGTYQTQGDANIGSPDTDPVAHDKVAGKVFATVEGVGQFVNYLRSTTGLLILSCVCLGIFGVPYLFGKYDEEDDE